MTAAAPAFRTGGEAAEIEAEKNKGSKFARTEWFKLDDGDKIILRFLTDSPEWIFVKQHNSVPTKNAPKKNSDGTEYTGKWPAAMTAVCRHDPAFTGMYTDCVICDLPILNPRDQKPIKQALRVWALAAVREEVREDGIVTGYKDEEIEYTVKDGDNDVTKKGKRIVVVNQGMQNFFASLQGVYGLNGTICDRDFIVQRKGEGLDTDYTLFAPDRTKGEDPSNEKFWGNYTKALKEQDIDLGEIVGARASDDYYGRFFDPNVNIAPTASASSKDSKGEKAEAPAPSAPVEEEASEEDLDAMRQRLAAYSG